MKKIIVFVLLIFMAGEINAQFVFGLKLGYNASKLTSNVDTVVASFNSGFHAGAFFRVGKRVHLQPEVYYTFSGGTFEGDFINTVDNWKQKVTIGSLDVPVLIGFKLIDSKILKWRIDAGPEVSFVVNSKITDVKLTGPITESDISTVNWYGLVGTGIDILFITFDVRYQFGFNSIINDVTKTVGTTTTNYPVNSKGNLFLVSLGFKIL
jgi:hypothetical protein